MNSNYGLASYHADPRIEYTLSFSVSNGLPTLDIDYTAGEQWTFNLDLFVISFEVASGFVVLDIDKFHFVAE